MDGLIFFSLITLSPSRLIRKIIYIFSRKEKNISPLTSSNKLRKKLEKIYISKAIKKKMNTHTHIYKIK